MTTTISPSLLSADFLNLEKELDAFDGIQNLWFHLDIMDGHYVPNLTFGHPIIKQISKIAKFPLDAHLMVENPLFYIETLKDCKIHNLTFHYETVKHHDRIIMAIKEKYSSVGLSINPGTEISIIPDYILHKIDLFLIMSVNPGFGGQKFIPEMKDKINYLRMKREKLGADFQIQIDGGVGKNNAEDLISCGVDNIVAGSYIFNVSANNYRRQVESLRA